MISRAVRPCSDLADSAALTDDLDRLALADSRIIVPIAPRRNRFCSSGLSLAVMRWIDARIAASLDASNVGSPQP